MSAEIDRLLDLRNYASKDQECWTHPDAKAALQDIIDKIDETLKEIKK